MKQIRRGLFETNSSSMHSIVVMKESKPVDVQNLVIYTKEDGTHAYKEMNLLERDGKRVWEFWDEELDFGRYPFKMLLTFPERVKFALANAESAECGEKEWVRQIEEIVKDAVPEFDGFEFAKKYTWWDAENPDAEYDDYGGIDHQSYGLLHSFLKNEKISLRNFLLDDRYVVVIDGDEYCDFSKYCNAGIIDTSRFQRVERGTGWDPEWEEYLEEHPELKEEG